MKNVQHTVGLDFGSLSVRAVVVRAHDGVVLSEAVAPYLHGVMDKSLTAGDGRSLPPDFALQVAGDYLAAMQRAVPQAVTAAGVDPATIIGIGVDSTSATVVVTDERGTPLSELPQFTNEPHAYVKMWKHHGAEKQADRIVALATERNEPWIGRYGGELSSEMLLPKALELLEEAPNVYAAAAEIVNMVDFVTWRLTGNLTYSASDSGYKRMYQYGQYPTSDFLGQLNPDFANVYEEKMRHPVIPLGARAGGLNEEHAAWFGLPEGIAVATGNIDAHVQAASVNAVAPGQLTGILGTSSCWVLPASEYREVPGHFGVVDGGIVAGFWGYEAGQSAVGDSFAWFVENCVPPRYTEDANRLGLSVYDYLALKASELEIGESGLIALDWWNGNRSTLVDADLSGLVIGATLATTPEEIYRAMVEATAFGARMIIENFEEHGVPVDSVHLAGGLLKSPFLIQIYADVTNRPLSVAAVTQAGAHGSAIFAAVAAGVYEDVAVAAEAMGGVIEDAYVPDESAAKQYEELYSIYRHLYDLFGREDQTMRRLKELRREASTHIVPADSRSYES